MANAFVIRRTGNVIEILGGEVLLPLLDNQLHYWHKTFYQGMQLRQRTKWLADQQELKRLGAVYDRRIDTAKGFNPKIDFTRVPMFHVTPNQGLAAPAGFLYRITQLLKSAGVQWEFKDLRSQVLPVADWSRLLEVPGLVGPDGRLLFKHRQDECLAAIDGNDGGVITCPTGYGKSFIATLAAKVWADSRIVFISPGLDTVKGLEPRLHAAGVHDVGVCGAGRREPEPRVTLTSADSLHNVYLERAKLILFDEVHCCSEERASMLARFTEAKFIGLSATYPGRSDGTDEVIEGLFGPILINISYQEGVDHQAITPIRVLMVEVPPFSSYHNPYEGEAWKRHAYWRNDFRNNIIANALRQLVPQHIENNPDPQMLAMVETIDHAYELRKYLPDFTLVYKEQDKQQWAKRQRALINRSLLDPSEVPLTEKVRDTYRVQFEQGTLKRAIATYVWKQGCNFVQLPVLARCDGSDTPILNGQIPGRLSRLHDGKELSVLIDTLDRFDEKAMRRSQGRISDYRKLGWDVQIIPTTAT